MIFTAGYYYFSLETITHCYKITVTAHSGYYHLLGDRQTTSYVPQANEHHEPEERKMKKMTAATMTSPHQGRLLILPSETNPPQSSDKHKPNPFAV